MRVRRVGCVPELARGHGHAHAGASAASDRRAGQGPGGDEGGSEAHHCWWIWGMWRCGEWPRRRAGASLHPTLSQPYPNPLSRQSGVSKNPPLGLPVPAMYARLASHSTQQRERQSAMTFQRSARAMRLLAVATLAAGAPPVSLLLSKCPDASHRRSRKRLALSGADWLSHTYICVQTSRCATPGAQDGSPPAIATEPAPSHSERLRLRPVTAQAQAFRMRRQRAEARGWLRLLDCVSLPPPAPTVPARAACC